MRAKTRIAAAVIAAAALVAAGGGGAALASSGKSAAATHAGAGSSTAPGNGSVFTWHPLHLLNGWTGVTNSARYYGVPSYAIKDGVLYLSGILQAKSAKGPQFAMLPPGARPKHYLWLPYYNFGGGGSSLIGNMEIEPDGSMVAYANGGHIIDPSLQAISFPLSS
jgi:hypothetical protein